MTIDIYRAVVFVGGSCATVGLPRLSHTRPTFKLALDPPLFPQYIIVFWLKCSLGYRVMGLITRQEGVRIPAAFNQDGQDSQHRNAAHSQQMCGRLKRVLEEVVANLCSNHRINNHNCVRVQRDAMWSSILGNDNVFAGRDIVNWLVQTSV